MQWLGRRVRRPLKRHKGRQLFHDICRIQYQLGPLLKQAIAPSGLGILRCARYGKDLAALLQRVAGRDE
ncbi:hypothetical protein D3C76_1556240 [compost metagenome]